VIALQNHYCSEGLDFFFTIFSTTLLGHIFFLSQSAIEKLGKFKTDYCRLDFWKAGNPFWNNIGSTPINIAVTSLL